VDLIISFVAEYLYGFVILVAIGYLIWQYRSRWLELIIAAVCIGGIAYLLAKLTANWISDPRPFIETGKPPLISSALDNGFPSDHTLLVAAVAAVVTLANWKIGLVFWALALVIGLARVYAGVHHMLDIAGSFVLVGLAMGLFFLGKSILGYVTHKSRIGSSKL
jgi:undecaprenyl-diphosphatase